MNINKPIDEKNYKSILANYNFTIEDALTLKHIKKDVLVYEEELLETFYNFIFSFNHAKSFLYDEEILSRHKEGIKQWYQNLFCGKYDANYFFRLNIISEVHVSIGLPAHYVNAAFSCVRNFLKEKLLQNKLNNALSAMDKILDINLDILTISYREEEQSKLIDEIIFLKTAVEDDMILPFIQPIYDSSNNTISKYEVLMRIANKNSYKVESVFPYLELSKKIKLYERMMKILIKKAFSYFKHHDIEFSINLSYEDIANEHFRDFIYKKIQHFIFPQNLIFEILETDFIEDFSIVEQFVETIRGYGCKIAIDDFGSGFSSMENILKIHPDIIKIDGSLIKNIDYCEESRTIVKNVINMAKELKAVTVAEYVHNKEVYEVVKQLGANYLQGFYLHTPYALQK